MPTHRIDEIRGGTRVGEDNTGEQGIELASEDATRKMEDGRMTPPNGGSDEKER